MRQALVMALLASSAAHAQEPPPVVVPPECVQFWRATTWDSWLSFAACSQDTTVASVTEAEQLPGLVEDLQTALLPTLQLYHVVVARGEGSTRLRAVFQMGMTQVSLMVRARLSVRDPALRAELEPLLEDPARYAWRLFSAVDRAATAEPALAADAVSRDMLHRARVYAAALRARWSTPLERAPLITDERSLSWPESMSSTHTSR